MLLSVLVVWAAALRPPPGGARARAQPRVRCAEMGKSWRRREIGRPNQITGAFMDEDSDEPPPESTEPASDDAAPAKWSKRSRAAAARWADPEFRERTLAKRRATIAARKQRSAAAAPSSPPPPPELSAADTLARERRRASRQRLFDDEEGWMADRLATGAEWRERLNNDDWKRERQRRRTEASARGYANRRAASGSAEKADPDGGP